MKCFDETDGDLVALHNDLTRLFECKYGDFLSLALSAGLSPDTSFQYADLRGMDLQSEDLTDFDFTGADFSGADLRQARLRCKSFERAELGDAKLNGAIMHYKAPEELDQFISAYPSANKMGIRFLKDGEDLAAAAEPVQLSGSYPSKGNIAYHVQSGMNTNFGMSDSAQAEILIPLSTNVRDGTRQDISGVAASAHLVPRKKPAKKPEAKTEDAAARRISLGAAVLSLWEDSFPWAFSQLKTAFQPFQQLEAAIRQLAEQMSKNGLSGPEWMEGNWLAAEKHTLALSAAMIRSLPSSSEADASLGGIIRFLSGGAHLGLIQRFAHGIWERSGQEHGAALRHWLAAEKQVLALSVAVIETSVEAHKDALINLKTALNSLDPGYVFDNIRAMAKAMWEELGCQPERSLDCWIAAEKHVITIAVAAIRQAQAGEAAAEVVERTLSNLSPHDYLEPIARKAKKICQRKGQESTSIIDIAEDIVNDSVRNLAVGTERSLRHLEESMFQPAA